MPATSASVAAKSAASSVVAESPASEDAGLRPTRRPDGKKWRIGYVDSGDYSEYPRTLRAIVQGLAQLGWLSTIEIPPYLDSAELWQFLVTHTRSEYLEFVTDAWWQPSHADPQQRPAVRRAIAERLAKQADLDLILAMGTWAGQDMAALQAPVPTIVASTSDAVAAKIIRSVEDSGLDNLHARVEPQRYQRQIRLFHDIYPFKRLGIVYEDSPEGRLYGGVDAVHEIAREAGFSVIACHTPSNGVPQSEATRGVLDCYRRLAPNIDAAYVTVHRGVTPTSVRAVAEILSHAAVPSFSMLGSGQVQQGILLSVAEADASYVGRFYARTIAHILNGAKPRSLSQVWIDPSKLAINLQTARLIGFDPPVEALFAADELFSHDTPGTPRVDLQ
ncbi:ABC transporter substrate-binding protein [Bordetella sp. 15P40C-2]|uniref:ABC transporter substrate-binding protein n=1 Tax=Bordetella sp. 15P40C-2 TaxID=2572246 RepID=UPI001325913D|nr:ABC transporter substrate binding protein [Bordetella sp. 15P40C-2]MVW70465.1 hypothetical protein [Bordetella sp. 15P40C-2]